MGQYFVVYRWPQRLLVSQDGTRVALTRLRGFRFALAELRALFFVLLRDFRFELVPGKTIERWPSVKDQPIVMEDRASGPSMPLQISHV